MADDVSKYCADYLRESYEDLKASHAHELVAAFFGYKSRAALLADKANSLDYFDQAQVLVPDSSVMHERMRSLNGLPQGFPHSGGLVDDLVLFLQSEELFTGEVWDCLDIGEYVLEEFLPAKVNPELDLELEDITKPINAFFEDIEYDHCTVDETDSTVRVTVTGTYSGYSMEDDPVNDDPVIDLEISVYLRRCAGRISFDEPEVFVSGTLRVTDEEADEDASDTEHHLIAT